MLIHLVFMFLKSLFLFFVSTLHNLWNSRNLFSEWKKNPYKAWRRASKWTTKLNID
jgi:hypothetical protein